MRANPLLAQPRGRPKDDDERVLPLINVVFLLLIFFMVAGQLSATDPFDIEPVRSQGEGTPEMRELQILLGPNGELALDEEKLEQDELEAAVRERLNEDEHLRVRLKADGRVEATRAVAVMERLRSAGVRKIELLTVPQG